MSAYLLGLVTLPAVLTIYFLMVFWIESRFWPFSGDNECLVCHKHLGKNYKWWWHRTFSQYHADHYEEWLMKYCQPPVWPDPEKTLARWRKSPWHRRPKNESN
jgi:hypothetical protein